MAKMNTDKYRQAYLAWHVLVRQRIRYCIIIDPSVAPNFQRESIKLQLESSLVTWLSVVKEKYGMPRLIEVPCTSKKFELQLFVGPDRAFPNLFAHQGIVFLSGRPAIAIILNTEFKDGDRAPVMDMEDTMPFLGIKDMKRLSDTLAKIRSQPALSIEKFAKQYGAIPDFLTLTTYPTLVHEIGHAFGLCDSAPSGFKNCDPAYLKPPYENTVMSDAAYVTPTRDDEEGIISVFDRTMDMVPRRVPYDPLEDDVN